MFDPAVLNVPKVSLLHGWLPVAVQVSAGVVLLAAIGWRTPRWRTRWLPASVVIGGLLAIAAWKFSSYQGMSSNPPPLVMWCWIALSGLAAAVLVLGWTSARWWRRLASSAAVVLCLLAAAFSVNSWVGYFTDVKAMWAVLTDAPVPYEVDAETVAAMRQRGEVPPHGAIVRFDSGSAASQFDHRREFVYLPPAWFSADPPPRLPAILMLGGEWGSPTDWLYSGDAYNSVNDFAAAHHGYSPILVFGDHTGLFHNDTECVNGVRGNAADHLTKDLVPYVNQHFGPGGEPPAWGVAGWSVGGTCAVSLAVMHPDIFTSFIDIVGDIAPNSGDRQQTIDRLFGGDTEAYLSFDPMTVMSRHGPYTGVSGWFSPQTIVDEYSSETWMKKQQADAHQLCDTGRALGISCAVGQTPLTHTLQSAGQVFAAALPWIAGELGSPYAPKVPFPE